MLQREEKFFVSMPTAVEQKCKTNSSNKMTPRPPFLSAFDYIFYLKRQLEKERNEYGYDSGDDCKDYSDPLMGLSIEAPKLSDLLQKLSEDLKLTRGSFVDDFINEPQNGISWILDLLRSSLNRQQCPGMVITSNRDQPNKSKLIKNKERQYHLQIAMTDEYDCLLCLKHVTNSSQKTLHKILSHRNGLLSLASCIVSNLIKSRIIAVELLTRICDIEPDGGRKVLEAMSTMRIIFGESVRFKLLVSILNSSSGLITGFEAAVLMFLNNLLAKSTSDPVERIRLQSELEEAGLNVNLIEKKAKEKSLPNDDPIWREIKIWNEKYIDVNECLKKNLLLMREKNQLKEKVDSLNRTVKKLEEDKKKLMLIEKELKEKTECLEKELLQLKSRLSKDCKVKGDCRRRNKPLIRPGSDNSDPLSCAVDSGRWSDSEEQINEANQSSSNEDAIDDQNVRNEDIFIYIPSIMPPANYNNYAESESCAYKALSEDLRRNKMSDLSCADEGLWRPNRGARKNDTVNEDRPQIIDVYRKPNKDEMISCSTSVVGADCEDTELMLDWQYPKIKKTESLHSESNVQKLSEKSYKSNGRSNGHTDGHNNHYHKDHKQFNGGRRRSHSTGHLVDDDDDDNERSGLKTSQNWTQFMIRSKVSSVASLNESIVEDNNAKQSKCSRSEKKSINNETNGKSKSFASSLQSYLFSGEKKRKSGTSSLKNSFDSCKPFPLPNVYKKNFITKGHANCGLYSGDKKMVHTGEGDLSSFNSSSSSVSKMLHREIALAAKEVGAFY